jgi:hypothetical protein
MGGNIISGWQKMEEAEEIGATEEIFECVKVSIVKAAEESLDLKET